MTQGQAERERPDRFDTEPAAVTREEFSAGFERCFGRVHAYVSRRVKDRETCERIVTRVLTSSLDLLVGQVDQGRELARLKVSSDRLIGLEAARGVPTGPVEP